MTKCPLGKAARLVARAGIMYLLALPLAAQLGRQLARRDPGEFLYPVPGELSTSFVRVDGACVSFDGRISDSWREIPDGSFFRSLERIDKPSGPTFRKGSQAVTDFPDQLYPRVCSLAARCSEDLKAVGPWPNATPDFVKGLRAEAGYVRDLHLHRLEITKVEEGALWVCAGLPTAFPTWYYLWVLKTNGVLLTDPLVVDLLSRDGRNMGRFTVDLAGRTGTWWYHWRDKGAH